MYKKRGQVLVENIIFIILNLVFLTILVLFLLKQGSGAIMLERTYAKQISLIIDSAEPGTIIKLNMESAKEVAKENNIDFKDIVSRDKNFITVKLSEKGGYTYSFFNDVEVNHYTNDHYYYFTIDRKI